MKSIEQTRAEARERAEAKLRDIATLGKKEWAKRQWKKLDVRFGADLGAKRERAKLEEWNNDLHAH